MIDRADLGEENLKVTIHIPKRTNKSAHFLKLLHIRAMENGTSNSNMTLTTNGETKQPFLIGVAGGTASGKVSENRFSSIEGP